MVNNGYRWTLLIIINILYNIYNPWRIHGAAIYGVPWIPNMDPINIPPTNVSINIPAPWIRHGI